MPWISPQASEVCYKSSGVISGVWLLILLIQPLGYRSFRPSWRWWVMPECPSCAVPYQGVGYTLISVFLLWTETDASLQGMATLEGDQVSLINCPDPAFSINDREYLAALLGLSRVSCGLFGNNTCSLWNLLKGKIHLLVMTYLSNKFLLLVLYTLILKLNYIMYSLRLTRQMPLHGFCFIKFNFIILLKFSLFDCGRFSRGV